MTRRPRFVWSIARSESSARGRSDHEPNPTALRQHLELSNTGSNQVDALLNDYADTTAIVVRFCETAGMLDASAMSPFTPTPRHLRAVSARAAAATAAILDGLGRAVALVDAIDGKAGLSDASRHAMTESLRDELNALSDHLQHQEITAQQLAHLESLFGDLRRRVGQVVSIFSPPSASGASLVVDSGCDRGSSHDMANAVAVG